MFFYLQFVAPVLSRVVGVASIWRPSRTRRLNTVESGAKPGPTQRLKTSAITSWSSQAIGAPSFPPYRLRFLSARGRQLPPIRAFVLAIGYWLFGSEPKATCRVIR
jgi:hypothetical protein